MSNSKSYWANSPPNHFIRRRFCKRYLLRKASRHNSSFNGAHTRTVVGLGPDLSSESLHPGDEVFLANAQNVILRKSPFTAPLWGEIATFDRQVSRGRLAIRWRDEELIVAVSAQLNPDGLKPGDPVRFDHEAQMAFERIEAASGERYLLREIPQVPREAVGDQDDNLDQFLWALTAMFIHPDKATAYGLTGRQSILMVGPSGCGKTLMARVGVSEIQRISGVPCRFAVIKPGEWEDPYVGVTQANIRNTFKALREAALDGYAVLFVDEVESIGRARGNRVGFHDDKFLNAFLAELDGFSDRKNVAIIAATNRKDMIDPALLERLSGMELVVRRPDMQGAEAIFNIHLPPALPFSPNGATAQQTRTEIIATAVSKLYSPNGDNQISTLKFRDGKTRTVAARELVSGRLIEQICRAACNRSFRRDACLGEAGLRIEDMEESVAATIARLRSMLTVQNARSHLSDLPQDMDLVAVEPIVRKVVHPHRYLQINV